MDGGYFHGECRIAVCGASYYRYGDPVEASEIDSLIIRKGTACYALSEVAQKTGAKGSIQAKFNLKAGPVQLQYDVAEGHAKAAIPHDV